MDDKLCRRSQRAERIDIRFGLSMGWFFRLFFVPGFLLAHGSGNTTEIAFFYLQDFLDPLNRGMLCSLYLQGWRGAGQFFLRGRHRIGYARVWQYQIGLVFPREVADNGDHDSQCNIRISCCLQPFWCHGYLHVGCPVSHHGRTSICPLQKNLLGLYLHSKDLDVVLFQLYLHGNPDINSVHGLIYEIS